MGKVILGFKESNSNMVFAITDIVIWLFKFAVKYIIYFTVFYKSFLTAVSETFEGKNIVTKTAFRKFFLRRSLPARGTSSRIL